MDKLLPHRVNETETAKHRRAFEKNAESDNMEAMENGKEKGMGITETRSAERHARWCERAEQIRPTGFLRDYMLTPYIPIISLLKQVNPRFKR